VQPPPAKKIRPADKGEETPLPKEEKGQGEESVRAELTFDVPDGARVYVDGRLMKTAGGRRTFQTPDLFPGQSYFYDVRVEVERAGRTLSDTKRIMLRAGQSVIAAFPNLDNREAPTARTED
jgi:uncharacterized protein (TIGR03000 family)